MKVSDAQNPKQEPGSAEDAASSSPVPESSDVPPHAETTAPEASASAIDYHDRYIRLAADFDNFRKRSLKERQDFLKYANENLVKDILPILDNFERALAHGKQTQDLSSVITGVDMVRTQMLSTLERYGVSSKESMGAPFDPTYHEAVSYLESPEHEPNTVIAEHQKAYFLHDRLIRPALVSVAAEKKAQDETEEIP